MLAVEIGIGIDHLRLNPKAKVHPQRVNLVDQRLESIRKFSLVHIPVAESRVVGVALAEPAVIHDEAVDAERLCLLSERLLPGFSDVHLGCFPGVVNHRPRARIGAFGENVGYGEVIQQTRSPAIAMLGVA